MAHCCVIKFNSEDDKTQLPVKRATEATSIKINL